MFSLTLIKELTDEELLQAGLYTNEIIWENRPVHISYMGTEAVKLKDKMRKFNSKLAGTLRIVPRMPISAPAAVRIHHLQGCWAVLRSSVMKSIKIGCRVEFVCGRRALLDADAKNSTLLSVAASLSVKPEQVPAV